MEHRHHYYRFSNGVTLVGEVMEGVSSAALAFLVPIGSAFDPPGLEGSAFVLHEMFQKGAGKWNAQELSDRFEENGVQRGHSTGGDASYFSFSCLAENLPRAIELAGALLLEPLLPEEELSAVRDLALQDLVAIEDEPQHKVMVELTKRFYSYPYNRHELGTVQGLNAITIDSLREFYGKSFVSNGVVIGVAGKFDWELVKDLLLRFFGDWRGTVTPLDPPTFPRTNTTYHIEKETNQEQIALASESAPHGDPEYYAARVGIGVLSGGMAGRLFVELREKRGLVYHVSASHSVVRGKAAVVAYAGTTAENGEETVTVMLHELRSFGKGVTSEELLRAKADLKSKVVMQSELSGTRAAAIASDYWHLARVRTITEIKEGIDSVTEEDLRRVATRFPFSPATLVTLGPKELKFSW